MLRQRIAAARELHVHGDFGGAIAAYEAVLADEPGLAEIWGLKGLAERQAGRLAQAGASVRKAIQIGGELPAFLLVEGGVLRDEGRLDEAEQRFAKVVTQRPDLAIAHVDLGGVRMDQGRVAEALGNFHAAVSASPGYVEGWSKVGIAARTLGRVDEAEEAFKRALALDPRHAPAHFNLACIHRMKGDAGLALHHAQVGAGLDPGNAELLALLGNLHRRNRQPDKALEAYARASVVAPEAVAIRLERASLLSEMGRTEEARREYRAVEAREPGNLRAALGARLLLPHVYASVEHIGVARQDYARGIDELQDCVDRFRYADGEAALASASWTNFYLAYQGGADRELQSRYADFLRRILESACPEYFRPQPRRGGPGRVRIGFVSHFFFNCTVGRYFASWITHLDPDRFERYVYYTNEWVGNDTKAIAAAASTWRHMPGHSTYAVARQVAEDKLDVLVYPELGMHPDTFAMAALRLAPVQCVGWGHPETTGHREIDWFISPEAMEPADAQAHYRERLARLPGMGTRYATPRCTHAASRADFGLPEGATLYLVPQSLFKIHPENDPLVAEVLARDPRGVVVMFASQHDGITEAFERRLAASFSRYGLALGKRARFILPPVPHDAYLRLNQLCDVMLDTKHWSGGNTSLDALSCGLPIVTLPGPYMRGRQSMAMLRILGLPELIARDPEDWIRIAVGLGRDRDLRKSLSARIQAGLGALFERDEPVRTLEDFLEAAAGGTA
jgi:protein O-GlcNAc transferase